MASPIPVEIKINGKAFEFKGINSHYFYMQSRKLYKQLNIDWLLENNFIKMSSQPFTLTYKLAEKLVEKGEIIKFAFIGQHNELDLPDGFVRFVN